ncbi:MAG TPA: HAMP domain-containing sensor histidine kinase, partial [Candidatus Aquilonibacter sp.]|nr:HAMP domain-containing sensor histidine kinase [Candidatus Aquilonibacter sp.]
IDVLTCALLLLVLGGFSTWLIVGISRAERAKLHAVADERRAAALEFQRFLADAGHELRTPLTIVSGYVDILRARDDASDPQLTTMLDGMRAETGRMRALVEKMLLLARLETPVAVPRLVDVAAVARDAAASMRAKYGERTLEVIDNDPASIVIDQDDLYEALHNLIENALKYAPDSPVRVYTGSAGRNAVVRVVDNGPGIPAGEREHVFRRFYRGNGRSDSDGSGLGLAIVVRVADRWNGNVQLDSTARETAFTLTFPLADEETHVVAG